MRIAMITSRYPYGGADQVAMNLVRALEDRHEVVFITTGDEDAEYDEDAHRRVIIARPPKQRFWHHYNNPSVVTKLKHRLAEFAPDVVHFHSIANRTFSAAALRVSSDYPAVWSLHDVWSVCIWSAAKPPTCEGMLRRCLMCSACPALSFVNWQLKERVFRRTDLHVVVPCEFTKSRIARSVLASKPVHVIPNGIDVERFSARGRAGVREHFDISPADRVVLFVGQMMNNWKGNEDLRRVASRVLRDTAAARFVFVGRHPDSESGDGSTILVSDVAHEKIPDFYASADVFAYPTHADNAPLVVLEAMAAGLPTVAYAVGGIPEQIVDGVTGFLVEHGDESAFERKLRLLLNDEERCRAMGAAALQRAKQHFSVTQQAAQTERLYEEATAERRDRAGAKSE